MILPQVAAGLIGFGVSYALIPWIATHAHNLRLLDFPDRERRLHLTPVPRLGGAAIFAAVVVAIGVLLVWDQAGTGLNLRLEPIFPGLVFGAVIVFATGVIDDLRGVTPLFKLVAQTAAAVTVMVYGFQVDAITLSGRHTYTLGIFSVPITILWIVGMTNAFNLIDGVDGLAGTVALIAIGMGLVVETHLHGTGGLFIGCAVFGSVIAFLRYNVAPARMFLGDSGSMLLGYFLSVWLVRRATTDAAGLYAIVPLFTLAYPLADTGISIARRWIRRHPFSRADGRHIHHQLLALGLSERRAVDLIGSFFLAVAVVGFSIAFAPPRVTLTLATLGAVLLFVGFFYGVRWLNYREFLEFGASVASVLRNARSHVRNKVIAGDIALQIPDAASFAELNDLLRDSAGELGLIDARVVAGPQAITDMRRIAPPEQQPLRVDFPITWSQDGRVNEAFLRIWCARPDGYGHIGVERIASRLAPAIEQWLRDSAPPSLDAVALPDGAGIRSSGMTPKREGRKSGA